MMAPITVGVVAPGGRRNLAAAAAHVGVKTRTGCPVVAGGDGAERGR